MFDHLAAGRWWDRAWSLVDGCTPCSPGCERCWLRAIDRRFKKAPPDVRFRRDRIEDLKRAQVPKAWAVWSDLFHEALQDMEISSALHMAGHAPRHVVMVLTKRAERMARWSAWFGPWPANVWAGVTVCNQQEADEKIPLLLQVPAAVRFVSYEPALGPVDISRFCGRVDGPGLISHGGIGDFIHWLIAGGESGPGARPLHPDWARSIRDQCQAAGVPFLFKQWGEWAPCDILHDQGWGLKMPGPVMQFGEGEYNIPGRGAMMTRCGKKRAGRSLDDRTWDQLPSRKEFAP